MPTNIRWAPRVPMEWLRPLHEQDAAGIAEDEPIDHEDVKKARVQAGRTR